MGESNAASKICEPGLVKVDKRTRAYRDSSVTYFTAAVIVAYRVFLVVICRTAGTCANGTNSCEKEAWKSKESSSMRKCFFNIRVLILYLEVNKAILLLRFARKRLYKDRQYAEKF